MRERKREREANKERRVERKIEKERYKKRGEFEKQCYMKVHRQDLRKLLS